VHGSLEHYDAGAVKTAIGSAEGLIAALRAGAAPREAGRLASSAAGATVQRLGGRPDLSALRA
jgi:sugar/nucleoside kinase (ribokinase family)